MENIEHYIKANTSYLDGLLDNYLIKDEEKVFQRIVIEDILRISNITCSYIIYSNIERFSELISAISFHTSSIYFSSQFFNKMDENIFKLKIAITKFNDLSKQIEQEIEKIKEDNEWFDSIASDYLNMEINLNILINVLHSFVPDFKIKNSNIIKNEIFETDRIELSSLPKFNLQQRFEICKRLGLDQAINGIKSRKQMSIYKVLALVMGISSDNAKKLLNGYYKELNSKDENILDEYIKNQFIVFQNKQKG